MKNKIIVVLLIIIAVLLYVIWQLDYRPDKDRIADAPKALTTEYIASTKEYYKCHFRYDNLTFFEKVKCDIKYKCKKIKK